MQTNSLKLARFTVLLVCSALMLAAAAAAKPKRYVVIDQDCAGPGGTDMQAILVLLQSPDVRVLGITVVTGDAWRDEEVDHALRLLEIVGRTDVPVVPGAVFPLFRTRKWTNLWEKRYGKIEYEGAWSSFPGRPAHGPFEVPSMPEGNPTTKASSEDAAHFLISMVRKYPHQVTVYAAGPLTNIAEAISIDPQFPSLSNGIVIMGGSLNPHTDDPEFATNPRHEFNFWFDPEASHIVLHAQWPSMVVTPVDVSIETHLTKEMLQQFAQAHTPVAQYLAKYDRDATGYLWDELAAAAWLDPTLITKEKTLYLDVDTDHGAEYGDTLSWSDRNRPDVDVQPAHVQIDVDAQRFEKFFVQLMTAPTPPAN